ncbi:FAD/NAD(P)-binding protein [Nocardiopsis ansamitocini]|uniref:Adenylate cyclase n=1 Tax=Nocardiopsis ansamitocini TaxID=1670832 RepID=A0A9W6P282_9ACTN|nr:FAD/NAD(P)-binding protein [Nocardiopsis ansamitocini]GLU45683.1 adenylate cyclase [Nocardiopsis ansamitocini]
MTRPFQSPDQRRAPSLAIIGAGPRATSLLERITANRSELTPGLSFDVHVIDPHPPGGGRIWRREQSRWLWMNTTADDCTMFTDESVTCTGPIVAGPTLTEWAGQVVTGRLPLPAGFEPDYDDLSEAARVTGGWFATRRLQSHYLSWVFWHVAGRAAPAVRVHTVAARAVDVIDLSDGRQRVVLDGDRPALDVDAVVLAQGGPDTAPTPEEERLARYSDAHGLTYLPTSPTADVSLDAVPAREPVIVRGLGLAFIDTMVLLTSGRGGAFRRDAAGELHYTPSGAEPVIHAGSRRGVPYHSKIHYDLPGSRPSLPRHFSAEAVAALGESPLDFDEDLLPLIVRELTDAAYRELAGSHPERLSVDADEFLARLDALDWSDPALKDLVAQAVPEEADRFDVQELDRPLAGLRFARPADLQTWMVDYLRADLHRRRDDRHSSDLAVFHALLSVFGVLSELAPDRLSPSSQERGFPAFMGFFSYVASGPPGPRLEELLALARAGVVRFIGAGTEVGAVDGVFRASSTSTGSVVEARALIEARLPATTLTRSTDPLLRALLDRGAIRELERTDPGTGTAHRTGLIDAAPGDQRLLRGDGSPHPARFGAGALVAGVVGAGGFSRPRTNAGFFRQNDTVARAVLRALALTR